MMLRCPHCKAEVTLVLGVREIPAGAMPTVALSAPAKKTKAKTCACGHDAHEGPCQHGKGTAFGGCPCPGQHSRRRGAKRIDTVEGESLAPGERAILGCIVQHGSCSSEMLTVITGYKRSTRDKYLQRLHSESFIWRDADGDWSAYDSGKVALGTYEKLPTGSELLRYWLERLPEGESIVLRCVIDECIASRETISTLTGYKRSTRDKYIQHLIARRLLEKVGSSVKASDLLYDMVK